MRRSAQAVCMLLLSIASPGCTAVDDIITAEYSQSGLVLDGHRDKDSREWYYHAIRCRSPKSTRGVLVRIGSQAAVAIADLTPDIVQNHPARPQKPENGAEWRIRRTTVSFADDRLKEAYFAADPEIVFMVKDKEFTLPIRQREFEAMFGKPDFVNTSRDWR